MSPMAQDAEAAPAADAWAPHRKLQRTLSQIGQALQRDPDSAQLHYLRACALQAVGDDEAARFAHLDALRRDPDHLGALTALGRLTAASRHRSAARMLLERAAARYPLDVASRVSLGTLLYEAGEAEAARAAFAEALRIAPDTPEAHAGISFALARLGEDTLAALHRHEAFARRSVIELPYRGSEAPVDVLMLASARGANAPIERFLDDREFRTRIVVAEFHDARSPLPAHHVMVNAIGDVDADPRALRAAERLIAQSSAPVINAPSRIAPTGRCENWRRLGQLPGVVTPLAHALPRAILASGRAPAALRAIGLEFPLLLRTPGYHTGEHFVLVPDAGSLGEAVAALPGTELIAMQFVDARDAHGKTRKFRAMMIDGVLYPLHLATSRHWKVHYFTADMKDDVAHRAADAAFLADMAGMLGAGAMSALRRIQECLGLDYGGIDFTLAANGEVVVFEANASMVVYQPDADPRWNYRRAAVARVQSAVRRMLLDRAAGAAGVPARRATRA